MMIQAWQIAVWIFSFIFAVFILVICFTTPVSVEDIEDDNARY
jgi:hypothetical protein